MTLKVNSNNPNSYSLQNLNLKIFVLKDKPLKLFSVKTFGETLRTAPRTMMKLSLHFSKYKIVNRLVEKLPKLHKTRFNNVEAGTEVSDRK